MKTPWMNDELIGSADELEIAPRRRDGTLLRFHAPQVADQLAPPGLTVTGRGGDVQSRAAQ